LDPVYPVYLDGASKFKCTDGGISKHISCLLGKIKLAMAG